MDHPRIERITVEAALSDPEDALDDATRWARAGDEDWQMWIEDWRAGVALIVELRVTVRVGYPGGAEDSFARENRCIWVEKHPDVPKVEEQIREMASKDFPVLAEEMQEAGVQAHDGDLEEMYVEVQLEPALRRQLREPPTLERGATPRRRIPPGSV